MSILVLSVLISVASTYSSPDNRKPIRLLALVPWPDSRHSASFDNGPSLLPAARVAISQINSDYTLLPGYKLELIEGGHEACGLTETNMALLNYVRYACNPPNGTVAVVVGLYCSTSAIVIAEMSLPVILKFSAANSPLFKSNNYSYPNFWRVMTSASIYVHMMISLMDRYNWTKIAIIQDLETKFYTNIGELLAKQLLATPNKTFAFHGGLVGINEKLIESSIKKIQTSNSRIVFVSATGPQVAKLLCVAAKENMIYPKYLWILVDFIVSSIEHEASIVGDCNISTIHSVLENSITSLMEIKSSNRSFPNTLPNAHFLMEYTQGYVDELEKANVTHALKHDMIYAGFIYDQIWAFTLALNSALPLLLRNNISVEDYGFNQPLATHIIEDSLYRVNFEGITGRISFTKYHEVPGCVNIYQITKGKEIQMCSYGNELNATIFSLFDCNLTFSEDLDDDLPIRNMLIPTVALYCLYSVTLCAIILTTAVFLLMYHYRMEPEIKSFSLLINSLIFISCYILCICQIISITLVGFYFSSIDLFSALCNTELLLNYNSVSLISVTLFVQLFRINRIFYNKKLKTLGLVYKNWFLILFALLLLLIPLSIGVIFLGSYLWIQQAVYESVNLKMFVKERIFYCEENTTKVIIFLIISTVCSSTFLVFNIVLASITRSITHKEFRNAKKINVFIFCVTVIQATSIAVIYLIRIANLMLYSQLINYLVALSTTALCQVILFTPKVYSVFRRKNKRVNLIH